MNKFKFIVSLILVLSMLMPISSFALFDETDDVCIFLSTPTLDGVINKDDGWSDPVVLNNDTLAVISANKQNPIDASAMAYMAYDSENLYFAAEITEFDEVVSIENLLCESDLSEPIDGGDYGFDGDVFALTIDVMSLLTADRSNYDKKAPFYCVGFDSEGNGGVYRSNGAAEEILGSELATAKVSFTENGWVFEASVSHEVVLEDLFAVKGIDKNSAEAQKLEYDYFYGNIDSKANFVYKSNRIDHEAEEVITYAEYASVLETSLDGTPGRLLYGTPIKTFGIICYINHEHTGTLVEYASEDDFATFEKDGERYHVCDVCGSIYDKEFVSAIPFTDVKAGQWYEKALIRCYNMQYFNGMSDTKFGPNVTMTRAMFVQVLANLFDINTAKYSCDKFTDVKANQWYYHSVSWAYECGITSGTSENKFSPNKPLTRQEAASLFANALKSLDMYVAPTTEFDAKYEDVDSIANWATDSMLWAVENAIISGTGATTLAPTGKATRMQVAQMLCQFETYYNSLSE